MSDDIAAAGEPPVTRLDNRHGSPDISPILLLERF
jgi:hypothetical protein